MYREISFQPIVLDTIFKADQYFYETAFYLALKNTRTDPSIKTQGMLVSLSITLVHYNRSIVTLFYKRCNYIYTATVFFVISKELQKPFSEYLSCKLE